MCGVRSGHGKGYTACGVGIWLENAGKGREAKRGSDIYKFTAAMSRDVARALLEIVQSEGYASTQEWFAATVKRKLRRKKIAAGAGTPTTSAEKMKSSLL